MSVPLRKKLSVELLEDLHTGTGQRGAVVDAVQMRTTDGRAMVPASHLRGLLRAAGAELVRLKLVTPADLVALFGAPGKGRGALTLTALTECPENQSGATADSVVWTAAQRQNGARGPEDDTLHSIEFVPAGTVLTGELELADSATLPLLERCLKRTSHLGAKRNRGSGLVKFAQLTNSSPVVRPPLQPTNQHYCLRLVLQAVEALCLPSTGAPINPIRSESFIRGQVLRGALAGWLLRTGGARDVARMLVEGEGFTVGDALPLPASIIPRAIAKAAVLPAPLALRRKKPAASASGIPWWADPAATADAKRLSELAKLEKHESKRPGNTEYIYCADPNTQPATWVRYQPDMGIHLRNQTPPHEGRPTGDGTQTAYRTELFATEQIAGGTYFMADLLFEKSGAAHRKTVVDALANVLNGKSWLTLGRHGAAVQVIAAEWIAKPPCPPKPVAGDGFTLVLVSDLIARAPDLGYYDALSAPTLCALAGCPDFTELSIDKAVADTVEVHGFNVMSGLPRAPALAIRRGSTYTITGAQARALMSALAGLRALGERTADGFGRFVVLDDAQMAVSASPSPQHKADGPTALREKWMALADRAVASLCNADGDSYLSRTQCMRLWNWAAAADTISALQNLITEDAERATSPWNGGQRWAALLPYLQEAKSDWRVLLQLVIRGLLLVKGPER
jgi:hypothetical protein